MGGLRNDYAPTAQALSLPLSPPDSPNMEADQPFHSLRPRSLSLSHSATPGNETAWERYLRFSARLQRRGMRIWRSLTLLQKAAFVLFMLGSFTIGVLFLAYSESIFAWLEPKAEAWRNMSGGWIILWLLAFFTAFPPLVGYSTCVTIAGFVYGFPLGWPIIATANVAGSWASFYVFRNLLSHWAEKLANADPRFKALTLVLKHDGLKLLVMIRLCPLPYSFSNGAMSTFQSVTPTAFALATAIASPKLLIHVFIGSRLRELARSDSHKMDTGTKIINYVSIIFGIALGIFTGWWVYTKTQARAKQLEIEEQANLDPEASAGMSRPRSAGLQHPDEFMDEDEDDNLAWGGPSPRLGDDDIDFLGEEDAAPYADEPEAHSKA